MTTKHLVYTALMTAIICILGIVPSVPLPFMPVPIVLQNIGIFLAGIILGRKLGTTSVIVFFTIGSYRFASAFWRPWGNWRICRTFGRILILISCCSLLYRHYS